MSTVIARLPLLSDQNEADVCPFPLHTRLTRIVTITGCGRVTELHALQRSLSLSFPHQAASALFSLLLQRTAARTSSPSPV